MNDLQRTLSVVVGRGPTLGSLDAGDVAIIREALERVTRRNGRLFGFLLDAIGAVFVLSLVAIGALAFEPSKAGALLTVCGVSLPLVLYFMRDSWRTKVQTDTLLVLVGRLDPDNVKQVLRAFLWGRVGSSSSPSMSPAPSRTSRPAA